MRPLINRAHSRWHIKCISGHPANVTVRSQSRRCPMATESLHDLYVHQLQDLYSAETQILDALPKMIDATSHSELKRGFKAHLKQTEEHVSRLEQILEDLGEEAGGVTCKGMQGLLKEGDEAIKEWSD